MGAFYFVKEINKYNKSIISKSEDSKLDGEIPNRNPIKPIIG